MQRITLPQARPGMVLADPAHNEQGTVVCGPGTELTESLIGRLERFGVARITVEGHPVRKRGEEKSPAELAAELDRRFAAHQDSPLMMELKAVFRDQLDARMQEMRPEGSDDAEAG